MTTLKQFITISIFLALTACGGAGQKSSGGNDIPCSPPFTLIGGLCDCPSGQHKVGNACEPDVIPDNTPPVVTITSPSEGATMDASGIVTVNFTATDASGISEYVFYVDSLAYSTNPTGTPPNLKFVWNGSGAATGSHELKVAVRDGSPNAWLTENIRHVVKPAPDPCAPWRSDLDGRLLKGIPTNYGPETGYFSLRIENGQCWAYCMLDSGGPRTESVASQVQYTSPPVPDGVIMMPDSVNGGFITFRFR